MILFLSKFFFIYFGDRILNPVNQKSETENQRLSFFRNYACGLIIPDNTVIYRFILKLRGEGSARSVTKKKRQR